MKICEKITKKKNTYVKNENLIVSRMYADFYHLDIIKKNFQ